MMKTIVPIIVYLIALVISVFLPASEGYDTFRWKLLVGQAYAIPALIITILIIYFINKKS